MRIIFLLFISLIFFGCHNTNPEQGAGGNKVEDQTKLSSLNIVDSAKSTYNQSIMLREKYNNAVIDTIYFEEKNKELMVTYHVLLKSLSPQDSIEVEQYRLKQEQEFDKKFSNKTSTQQ